MAFFIPSYIQKRLLHYALSRLEVLDTDALELESLDIGLGKRSVIELRDIGLRRPKVAALLHLPASFDLSAARVGLVRVTIPADIHVSPIVIELSGIQAVIRVLASSEERPSPRAQRQRTKHKPTASSQRRSSRDSDLDYDSEEEDVLPSTQDLAKSFLAEEPLSEREQLEAALNSQSVALDQSVASTSTSEEDPTAGYGVGLSLPGFLAGFLKDIANRVELQIRDVALTFEADAELTALERRSLIEGSPLQPISLRISLDEVEVKGVLGNTGATKAPPEASESQEDGNQAMLRIGKRLVILKGVRGSLLCEHELFKQLFKDPEFPEVPSTHESPVSSWSKQPDRSIVTTYPDGFIESNSPLGPGTSDTSHVDSDADKFADADEDETSASVTDAHNAWIANESPLPPTRQERHGASGTSAFEDAEDSSSTSLAASTSVHDPGSHNNLYPSSIGTLQDALRSFKAERAAGFSSTGSPLRSSPAAADTQPSLTAPSLDESTHCEKNESQGPSDSLYEQEMPTQEYGLSQSMLFSHEQAKSIYMSVHEPSNLTTNLQQIPGAWQDHSDSSLNNETQSVSGNGEQSDNKLYQQKNADTVDPMLTAAENDQHRFSRSEDIQAQNLIAEVSGDEKDTANKAAMHHVELLYIRQIQMFIPGLDPPQQTPMSHGQGNSNLRSESAAPLSRFESGNIPGEFSIYAESRKRRSDSGASRHSVEQSQIMDPSIPKRVNSDAHNQIEINLDHTRIKTDVIAMSILVQALKKIVSSSADQRTSKEPKEKSSGSESRQSPSNIRIQLADLELHLLEALRGDIRASNQHGPTMFFAKAQNISLYHSTQETDSETSVSVEGVSLGYKNEEIFRFDKAARIRTSVRDANELNPKAISVTVKSTAKSFDCTLSTLPIRIHLDLDRFDETIGGLGGLSGLLELGSSIFSEPSAPKSPKASLPTLKGRTVRFETPEPVFERGSQVTRMKTNVRIGGIRVYLGGRKCGILFESTAVKAVARDDVIGLQIDESRLSGPYTGPLDLGSAPIAIKLRNAGLKYLFKPEEGDLTRLISLLTPSKDKFEAEDDFLVDTLIRQRRNGSVLRANVDSVDFFVSNYKQVSVLSDFVNDLGRLSSLTKYLPQDSRPGLLTLAAIKTLSLQIETHKALGAVSLLLKGAEIAHIGVPLLVAFGVQRLECKYGDDIELIREVVPYKGPDNPLMLMARMIGDELEPTLKLKLWNTCFEYSVPLMVAVKDLTGEEDTDHALMEAGFSVTALADHSNPAKARSKTAFSSNTGVDSRPLKLDLALRDCAIGLKPDGLASKALVLLTDTQLRGSIPDARGLKSTLDFRRAAVLLIDDEARLAQSRENAPEKATLNDIGAQHVAALCRQGFVSVLSLSAAHAILEMKSSTAPNSSDIVDLEFHNDLFVLETCADSTKTLGDVFGALSPPSAPDPGERYRTEVAPVMDMMASFTGDAFPIIPTEREKLFDNEDIEHDDEFGDEELEADLDAFGDFGDLDRSLGSDVEKDDSDDPAQSLLLEDPQTQTIDPIHGLDDARSEILGGSVVQSAMPPRVEGTAHKWDSTRNKYAPVSVRELAQSPVRVRVRDMHIIWHLYDGYDWEHTREAITQAVMEVENRVEERRSKRRSHGGEDDDKEPVIEDFLFNSIYIGIPAHEDPRDLSRKINKDLDDLVSETGTQLSTTPSRPSTLSRNPKSQSRRLKLERSKRHKITFELRGASADIFHFAPGGETQQSIDLRVKDLEIFDHVPTSTWKKFATYMHDTGPREEKKPMVHIEICNVRPVPDLTASELVLRVTVLPLRLHVDQDALDFMTRFFEFADDASKKSPGHNPAEQPYLQRVEVRAVPVKLDYKPKKVDYGGLRSGRTTEFMNFFILDGADMVLKHAIVYGCSGFTKLHKALEDVWMPDIKSNQLPGVLSGLNGVRTLVNMGTGMRDLVVIPVREYRKDGRVVRSVSKGALAFARTTGSELTRFGAKLAVGAQTALQGAEDFFSRASSSQTPTSPSADWETADLDAEERRAISHYADQPTGILQGLKGAARSLERDLLVTRDVIIAVSGEVRESGSAEGVARAVARHAPTLVLRPMIGASKAVGQALMGATNTVDPGNRKRMEDKYKSY